MSCARSHAARTWHGGDVMSSGQRSIVPIVEMLQMLQDCKQLANKSAFAKKNPLWPLFANEVASAVQLVTNDILNMGNWMKDNDYPHLPPNPFISATNCKQKQYYSVLLLIWNSLVFLTLPQKILSRTGFEPDPKATCLCLCCNHHPATTSGLQ